MLRSLILCFVHACILLLSIYQPGVLSSIARHPLCSALYLSVHLPVAFPFGGAKVEPAQPRIQASDDLQAHLPFLVEVRRWAKPSAGLFLGIFMI